MGSVQLRSDNDVLECNNNHVTRDHLLWEITSICNQNCIYCYPSRTIDVETSEENRIRIAKEINQSNFFHIHVTGGEPTACPNIYEIIEILSEKSVHISTNLSVLSEKDKALFSMSNINSVSISLDSVDSKINDQLRSNGEIVKNNILKLIKYKKDNGLNFHIRIHCVMTKLNLAHIPHLLQWAREIGIDEVSCQPVSLPVDHRCYRELNLTYDDIKLITYIYNMEQDLFNSKYSLSHLHLLSFYLKHNKPFLMSEDNVCIPFIDAKGILWNCPNKKKIIDHLESGFTENNNYCSVSIQCMTSLKHLCW